MSASACQTLLRHLQLATNDGWGFVLFDTSTRYNHQQAAAAFAPLASERPPNVPQPTETPEDPTLARLAALSIEDPQHASESSGLSAAETAIEKIRERVNAGIDRDAGSTRPEQAVLRAPMQWTVIELPGANIRAVRAAFQIYMSKLNRPTRFHPSPQNHRMCLMVDDNGVCEALEEGFADSPPKSVTVVDPRYPGEPVVIAGAMGHHAQLPPYNDPGTTLYYLGKKREDPANLLKVYAALVKGCWDFVGALELWAGPEVEGCVVGTPYILANMDRLRWEHADFTA